MKKKIILFIILFLVVLLPINTYALSKDYKDVVSDVTKTKVDEEKINLYLFRGEGCPHCADEEEFLEKIKKEYKDYLNIYDFEVWYDEDNSKMMKELKEKLDVSEEGVPFTIIGEDTYVGYSDVIASRIENSIKKYAELDDDYNKVNLPILGKVNMSTVSIPIVAVILGFIDGFNPCAMWILLFLINMLFTMKSKRRRWILGFTFLFVSAFVYFLSMLGINFVLEVAAISIIKKLIAVFILVAGVFSFRKYLKIRDEEAGCTVVDDKKRKKIITRMKKIINSKSFLLSFIGIVVLATSVNLIELACSLGFPMIFTELLNINGIKGIMKIIYLLIYIFFYMFDDMLVFIISMTTLEATGVTNKYNKLCTLISAIIMIIMGLLLLLKPEWLMLNF